MEKRVYLYDKLLSFCCNLAYLKTATLIIILTWSKLSFDNVKTQWCFLLYVNSLVYLQNSLLNSKLDIIYILKQENDSTIN